jgi:CRISPR-associated endonuclease Csy4
MKFFLDIGLVPDAETNLGFLWQKVFQQVHIALVENGYESERKLNDSSVKILRNSKIAVSFPEYGNKKFSLGSKLRLFSETNEELEKLNIDKWLNRLTDYVQISSIQPVPDNAAFMVFKQKRVKGVKRLEESLNKKADHISKKYGVDKSECLKELKIKHHFEKSKLPFIQLESQTSKKRGEHGLFQIFIEKLECSESAQREYDCYGLALTKTATIPWF